MSVEGAKRRGEEAANRAVKAALGTSQWAVDRIRELEEENERLRADVKMLRAVTPCPHKARIEAALVKAESVVRQADEAAQVASDPRGYVAIARTAGEVVKALKGEKP